MNYPKVVYLEAVVMDNNEVFHFGKSLGYIGPRQRELLDNGATKLTKGSEDIVAIRNTSKDK